MFDKIFRMRITTYLLISENIFGLFVAHKRFVIVLFALYQTTTNYRKPRKS